jgi:hypothetical protein
VVASLEACISFSNGVSSVLSTTCSTLLVTFSSLVMRLWRIFRVQRQKVFAETSGVVLHGVGGACSVDALLNGQFVKVDPVKEISK